MNFLTKTWKRLAWALTPPARKKRQLDEAVSFIDKFHETHALLELARSEGITISLSGKLIGSGTNGHFAREQNTGRRYIELAPRDRVEDLIPTLIHELRHVWQGKVLGATASNLRREEPSAELAALFTRVREADAFAFTAGMITHINYASDTLHEAMRQTADDVAALGKKGKLDDKDLAALQEKLNRIRHAKPPDIKAEMTRVFNRLLETMDDYDRKTLHRYYVLYAHPQFDPVKHVKDDPLDVARLRQILKIGVSDKAPAYMDDLDDAAFAATVMKDVAPQIRSTLKLMDAFEAAAAKGALSANDNQFQRYQIADAVSAAEASPRPKIRPAHTAK